MSARPEVHSFDFSKLPQLTSQEVALRRSLLEAYPALATEDAEEYFKEFFRRFSDGLPFEVRGKFVALEEESFQDFQKKLPQHCFVFHFQAEPQSQNLWLHVEGQLSEKLIGQTLGKLQEGQEQSGSISPLSWPLNEVSKAALEFMALKALQALNSREGSPTLFGPQQLSYQGLHTEPTSLEIEKEDLRGLKLRFFLVFLNKSGEVFKGYVHLHLPHPWLTGVLLREDMISGLNIKADESKREAAWSRVSHVNLDLVSEVGQVNLQSSDWQQLEAGDVVLFDETQAKLGPHGLSGKAVLKVGEGSRQGFLVELIDAQEKLTVKVLDFYGGSL